MTINLLDQNFINTKKTFSFYLKYTLYFFIFSLVIFCWILFRGKNFIYSGDGFWQHYPAYIYYGQWLRKIIKNVFIYHQFSIPNWDFNIGYGSDIIKTLCYYVIGDPFTFPLIFIPSKFVHYYFNIASLLRLYCAGISFITLCKEFSITNKKTSVAIFAGTFTYVFYFYAIYNVARHPFFLNPLIFFPLIITGLERIIKKQSPLLYISSISVSAASNFYFFYMIVLLTVVYGVAREVNINKRKVKKIIIDLSIILLWSVLGVTLSAWIFIPTMLTFIGDARSSGIDLHLFYSVKDFAKIIFSFFTVTNINWTTLGFSIVSCLTLFYCLFKKNDLVFLKVLICINLIMLTFPFFGQILNGFSYVSNRWNWAFALLVSFVLVYEWDEITFVNRKTLLIIVCFTFIFVLSFIQFHKMGITKKMIRLGACQLVLLLVFCFISFLVKPTVYKQVVLLLMVYLSIVGNSIIFFSPIGLNYSSEATTKYDLSQIFNNEATIIKEYRNKKNTNDFSRYTSDRDDKANYAMIIETPGTQYYWSLSNPNIIAFNHYMGFSKTFADFAYNGLDDRSILNALFSIEYFYTDDKKIPFGFKGTEVESIYETQNYLPFGYCYEDYIDFEEWKTLDSVVKQEVLIQKVVLEKDKNEVKDYNIFSKHYLYECVEADGIILEDDGFIASKDNASFVLRIPELSDKEVYVDFSNFFRLDQEEFPSIDDFYLKFSINEKLFNYLKIKTKSDSWYSGQTNFTSCLGYVSEDEPVNTIKISVNKRGKYHFDSMSIIAENVKESIPYIRTLQNNKLENVVFKEDYVSGDFENLKKSILVLSIPYEKGWAAYIDGKKTKIFKANIMFSGVEVPEGRHRIVLKYKTPGIYAGICSSLISLICLLVFIFLRSEYFFVRTKDN